MTNKSSVSNAQGSIYLQILYCVLERYSRTANQTLHGNKDWSGSKVHQNTERWTELMVSRWNSSGISSQVFIHCRSIRDSNAQLVPVHARRFRSGQWSLLGPDSERKCYSISEDSPQGEWDKMAELMMVTLRESGHPVFRSTSSLSRGQC